MAVVHAAPTGQGQLSRLMTTDFCPWANRFVDWLKEPVGWFALATAISVMIGLYFSPIGWTLAASLTAIMIVGMAWPLVAVYVTTCELHPEVDAVHEDEPCRMIFTVRNRIPLPVWGLSVERYLDCDADESAPTVGLSCAAALSTSEYGITVRPKLRGHYPIRTPSVACSFPFGIWTARRKLTTTKPLTVWPKVFPIAGACPIAGRSNADLGDGQRGGRSGDFVGVRAYRRGDAAKHVNWIASARTDTLIVTERGGPQCVELDVWVDLARAGRREQLSDRMRVAASVLMNLHQSTTPMRIMIGDRSLRLATGAKGRTTILNALADVPADGSKESVKRPVTKNALIEITRDASGQCICKITNPVGGRRAGGCTRTTVITAQRTIAEQVLEFWRGVRDDDVAA